MSDQPAGGDPFANVPLFREIQRLLTSSSGPVNWELARQVGVATAVSVAPDLPLTDEDRTGFVEASRIAELQIASATGLSVPAEIAAVDVVGRAQWVESSITDLRDLVEPASARVSDGFLQMQPEVPEGTEAGPLAAGFDQVIPLLLGMQAGAVFGTMAQQVFGRYDIAMPRPGPSRLQFVVPNIAAFEHDWSLPPAEFRQWIALHEVAHRFEFAQPWVREHLLGLVRDFMSTLEVDVSGLQQQLEQLDPMGNPESLQGFLQGGDGLFGAILDDEQRLKLHRIQSFMAAAEGYGDHVMHAVGRTMLSVSSQIEEAMRRYREDEHGDPVFERLLGIEMRREHYALGRDFCDVVAETASETVLATMWNSPDALPSMPELQEPLLWMARTA
ncbi:MAG: zinc-dependent metalloprotease [Actinomycetota bacterium]